MKRRALLRHLAQYGCVLRREGGSHSVIVHPALKRISTVPRHREIAEPLAVKICRDLGIPRPGKS